MFKIIRRVHAYAPKDVGIVDILVVGTAIAKLAPRIDLPPEFGAEEYDCTGLLAIPGLIDGHVHICGGGGEGGPVTRTPEIMLSEITTAGITTVVGLLGTDAVTRSMAGLLAKANGLQAEGISTFIYSGAYQLPARTLLENLRQDLTLVDKVVGAGEIAISDHRSAQPQVEDLAKLAAEARVGGMLGGKAGILHLHLGEGKRGLTPINQVLEVSEIPITQFLPTHVNRTTKLFQQSLEFLAKGGNIDLTAGGEDLNEGILVSDALALIKAKGLPLDRVTVTSDGNGSLPLFDAEGKLTGLAKGSVQVLWHDLRQTVQNHKLSLAEVLPLATTNTARILQLPSKGNLASGYDADITILDADLHVNKVFARGRLMVDNGRAVVWGAFEPKDQA
ncbi:MAG: beta-aspartyl-peptidase [Peptococcaceae bacterium]|nr:beta-aspartyl-peptidase [Peptococcaceae bacterium]